MNIDQLYKISQTYTNKYYTDRTDSVKSSQEIVNMVLEDLGTFEELYGTTDLFELIEKVSNDVVNELKK